MSLPPFISVAASNSAKQQAQDELQSQTQVNKQLQASSAAAQEAAQRAQQQVWQLQQSNTQLAQQAAKQAAESDFLEGELGGLRNREVQLREQAAVQQEQVCGNGCKNALPALHTGHAHVMLASAAAPQLPNSCPLCASSVIHTETACSAEAGAGRQVRVALARQHSPAGTQRQLGAHAEPAGLSAGQPQRAAASAAEGAAGRTGRQDAERTGGGATHARR